MTFESLGLTPELLRALADLGHATPTPVQQAAIPPALEGRDLLAAAQTGTGKTGGFALPLLQRLQGGRRPGKAPRALVLTPTRELAMQVQESVKAYGRHLSLRSLAVFGGVGIGGQRQALARGVDVLVATPGRLLDHLGQGSLDLSKIELLVLDEADRMLDMGFLPALKRVLAALPAERQTLLFSATFAPPIRELAGRFLRDPLDIQITPPNAAATTVHHVVHPVEKERKRDLLIHLMSADSRRQTLVFSRTKHGADRLCKQLDRAGFRAAAIHGNRSQNQRVRALTGFKNGDITVLVATDIAARGLDIEQLPVVINHDLPNVPEDYVHRIGRTGRAGADGLALSLVSHDEAPLLRDIVRVLGRDIRVEQVDGFAPPQPLPAMQPAAHHNHRGGNGGAQPAGAARNGQRRRRRRGAGQGEQRQGR